MKDKDEIIPVWDYIDDYYFTHVDDIEINIRVYEDDTISVWVFDNKKDVELLEDDFRSVKKLENKLNDIFQSDILLPSLKDIKKVTLGGVE